MSFGFAIGLLPPMVDEISADLGLTRSAMGSILGAWALIYIFTAIPGGAMVERLGLRRAMLLGGASIALSGFLRAVSPSGLVLFVAVAIFGIGGPLVSISTPKLMATLFDEQSRRLPTGIGVASPGFGSALGLALANPVLLPAFDGNWRGVVALGGGVAIAACAYWWWVTSGSDVAGAPGAPLAPGTFRRLLRLSTVRWILLLSLFLFAYAHALSGWLPEILVDAGLSDDVAGYAAAASIVAGIIGAIAISRSVPAPRREHAIGALFLALALCGIGLATLSGAAILAVTIALGFVRSGAMPLMFLVLMDDEDIGPAATGAATGLFFAVAEVGGFGGPWLVGTIADRTDGFSAATLTLAGIAAVGAVVTTGLARRS